MCSSTNTVSPCTRVVAWNTRWGRDRQYIYIYIFIIYWYYLKHQFNCTHVLYFLVTFQTVPLLVRIYLRPCPFMAPAPAKPCPCSCKPCPSPAPLPMPIPLPCPCRPLPSPWVEFRLEATRKRGRNASYVTSECPRSTSQKCRQSTAAMSSISVQCTPYSGNSTMYTVLCKQYHVHCTPYTITAHCTLYNVHLTPHTIHCTLYTIQCILYGVHCTVIVSSIVWIAVSAACYLPKVAILNAFTSLHLN